jgi:hypothetical protein
MKVDIQHDMSMIAVRILNLSDPEYRAPCSVLLVVNAANIAIE